MIAIIGDLIHSKKITDRNSVQDVLFKAFHNINEKYAESIISNFTITLGDEFQGVVYSNPLRILDEITVALYPTKVRFGLGIGELSTAINRDVSLGADGPAYWYARDAISMAHKDNDYKKSNIHVLCSEDLKSDCLDLVNEILKLTAIIQNRWTDSQIEVLKVMLENDIWQPDFYQKDIARLLDIDDSALARRLSASDIKRYLQSRKTAENAIERINNYA